jgi:hypothetical protein
VEGVPENAIEPVTSRPLSMEALDVKDHMFRKSLAIRYQLTLLYVKKAYKI